MLKITLSQLKNTAHFKGKLSSCCLAGTYITATTTTKICTEVHVNKNSHVWFGFSHTLALHCRQINESLSILITQYSHTCTRGQYELQLTGAST